MFVRCVFVSSRRTDGHVLCFVVGTLFGSCKPAEHTRIHDKREASLKLEAAAVVRKALTHASESCSLAIKELAS